MSIWSAYCPHRRNWEKEASKLLSERLHRRLPCALRAARQMTPLPNRMRSRPHSEKAPCSVSWINPSSALPRYQRYVLDLAEEKGLAVQSSVREGGGNNGAIINTALDGIPVIVVGVPVRYIHSHYGITSYYDFEATVQLATEVVRSMTADIIRSF